MKTHFRFLAALLAGAAFHAGAATGEIEWINGDRGIISSEDGATVYNFYTKEIVNLADYAQYSALGGFRVSYDSYGESKAGPRPYAFNVRIIGLPIPVPPPPRTKTGTVRQFDSGIGQGFISVDGGGDLFVNGRNVVEPKPQAVLKPGDRVAFAMVKQPTASGMQAVNIQVTQAAPDTPPNAKPADDLSGRRTGVVKRWDTQKGYGYITPDRGGDDVFVHFSQLKSSFKYLAVGQAVGYDLQKGPKGIQATNVGAP